MQWQRKCSSCTFCQETKIAANQTEKKYNHGFHLARALSAKANLVFVGSRLQFVHCHYNSNKAVELKFDTSLAQTVNRDIKIWGAGQQQKKDTQNHEYFVIVSI